MLYPLDQLLQEAEGEEFERKSSLDPSSPKDMLGLIADIVAMSNTRGGKILIGTTGTALAESSIKLFDSARIDDKVNSFSEPNVGGITSVQLSNDFLLVEVQKSRNPPHVFKKEGNYNDPEKGQSYVFRSRDILVRHSSKTDRANRSDLDRMFTERQQTLFEKVRMVFEAPAEARIQVVDEGLSVPVRIDPAAPDARPVYDILTPSPFRDVQQELIGAVKSWKTSHQLLNETQIMKAYLERKNISDPEIMELLLRSCWERHIPGCCWAARIGPHALPRILEEGIVADAYPSSTEALRVASLLPRTQAIKLFKLAQECKKRSVSNMAKKLDPVLRARTRKYEKLIEIVYPLRKIIYVVPNGIKSIEFEKVDDTTLDEITGTVLAGTKENRAVFKIAESILYAQQVADLPFPEEPETDQLSEVSNDVKPD